MATPKIVQALRLNAILVANLIKQKIVGMEPTRPTIRGLSDISNKKGRRIPLPNKRQLNLEMNQKTNYTAPALRGNSRREVVFNRRSPTTYAIDTTIECNGTQTEGWLRRQALASITSPLPQPEKEETYAQDKDYRGDHIYHANLIVQPPFTIKEQSVATQREQNENAPDDQLSSQSTEEDTYSSPKKPIFPDDFPISLNSIKEYVTEKYGSTYIQLHSTIPLKKQRRKLCL